MGCLRRKQQKELAKLKAPPEYALKVNFGKVVLPPINAWVVKRVQELLKGLDDEVLVGTIIESLKQVSMCCCISSHRRDVGTRCSAKVLCARLS